MSENKENMNLENEVEKDNTNEIPEEVEETETEEAKTEEVETEEVETEEIETEEVETEEVEVENKKTSGVKTNIKKSFTNSRFKSGAYSSLLTIVVIAIVILINLAVTKLDITTDLSVGGLFTLSEDTKELLKKLDGEITLYYMVSDGNENEYIEKVLDQYAKETDKIKIVKKDPVLYPTFGTQYTTDVLQLNDVIVVNEKTDNGKLVSATDMYYSESDYMTGSTNYYLDTEGQITSGIQYVTMENAPKMYVLSGHNEVELGEGTKKLVTKLNIQIEELALSGGEIPEDCEILMINGPQGDFLEDEAKLVKDYLANGGKAIIISSYTGNSLPNFESILEYYGVTIEKGLVFEGQQGAYYVYPNYLVPILNSDSEITQNVQSAIIPGAQGLNFSDEIRGSVTITSLLDTTDSSFSKSNENAQTYEKEKGDVDGPFSIAAAIEEKDTDNTIDTKLVLFTSPYAFLDDYTGLPQIGNADLLTNSISWMSDTTLSEVTIAAKSLSSSQVTLSNVSMITLAILVIFIIPLGLLITGFIIWMMRRKS